MGTDGTIVLGNIYRGFVQYFNTANSHMVSVLYFPVASETDCTVLDGC